MNRKELIVFIWLTAELENSIKLENCEKTLHLEVEIQTRTPPSKAMLQNVKLKEYASGCFFLLQHIAPIVNYKSNKLFYIPLPPHLTIHWGIVFMIKASYVSSLGCGTLFIASLYSFFFQLRYMQLFCNVVYWLLMLFSILYMKNIS